VANISSISELNALMLFHHHRFAINLAVPILNVLLFGRELDTTPRLSISATDLILFRLPTDRSSTVTQIALKGGVVKAAANLGCIVGQIGFGLLGDIYGRRRVWPAGLCVTIIGTVLIVAAPLSLGGKGVFTWITIWRVIMGIGIGGDYPMSSAAISDRSATARRGMLLAFTFSMQGWGNLIGGIVTLVIIYAYKSSIMAEDVAKLNGVWRLIFGVILIPCFGTLYQRIVLPESQKYKNARALQDNPELLKQGLIPTDDLAEQHQKQTSKGDMEKSAHPASSSGSSDNVQIHPDNTAGEMAEAETTGLGAKAVVHQRRAAFGEFIEYFSDRKHALTLFSTAANWFLLDIAFYGINLNQR
jgi:PHS family inorganic phosphate transporter-like MFS transporter